MNILTKGFQRRTENFTCEHCGAAVVGNGYTNHCPKCLWCKHVDINPGDRKGECGGMMKPVRVESDKKGFMIVHECQKCFATKRNRVSPEDDFTKVVEVQKSFASRLSH